MSALFDFLTNATKGYPVNTEILDLQQTQWKNIEKFMTQQFGNIIVEGMNYSGGIQAGYFFFNGELLYFDGIGSPVPDPADPIPDTTAIKILETTTQLQFCDASLNDAYTIRTATHATDFGDKDLVYDEITSVATLKSTSSKTVTNESDITFLTSRTAKLEKNPLGNEPLFTDNADIATTATSGGITDLTLASPTNMLIWKEPNGRVTIVGQLNVNAIQFNPASADGLLFDITNLNAIFTVPSSVTRIYADQCYYSNSAGTVYQPLEAYMNKADGKVYFEQRSHGISSSYVVGTIFIKMTYFANTLDL